MKKAVCALLVMAVALSLAACGTAAPAQNGTAFGVPGIELKTLNAVMENGYAVSGTMISENVFGQTVTNENGEEYILVVKVPAELRDALEAVDFLAEDSQEQYLDLIGDIELAEAVNTADLLPDQAFLDAYKGKTVAEFEADGAEINGFAGIDGKYSFFFNDAECDYRVELEDGVLLDDLDDTYLFDAAIQDMRIGKLECTGLTDIFVQSYIEQFVEPAEKPAPKDMGSAVSGIDELNSAIGSNIKAVPGAAEEKFSVIDGKIAQYVFSLNGYSFCIRAAADTDIDLADDSFEEDPLVDDHGYVTTVSSQTDTVQSFRFVFNGYQYAYMIYDNGEYDYMELYAMQGEYKNTVCEYGEDSVVKVLLGSYSSDDGYEMSGAPVSEDTVQVAAYTYDDTCTKIWTMLVRENNGELSYDSSILEIYMRNGEENPAPSDAGSGSFTAENGTIIWDGHVFM